MENKELFGLCPYVTTQKLLSGKWSIYILYLLSENTIRFNELLRLMPKEMTHTTLSRQLKLLEEKGLIIRNEYNQVPPKVEYTLSDIGRKFLPVLDALKDWGDEYIEFFNSEQTT
ncbi:MAG: helix-turn-helix domain-containing protein [Eubacteriales bacterium]